MTDKNIRRGAYINPCEVLAVALGAGAASVGTVNTSVFRWSPVPAPTTADIVVTDSATLGMSFALNQPGRYDIEVQVLQVAGTTLSIGASINAAVAPLVANPAINVDGCFSVRPANITAAGVTMPLSFTTWLRIQDSAVGAVLRILGTNGAGASPEPSITEATCFLRIIRSADMG